MSTEFDAVLIGRNEAARLGRALSAVQGQARRVIYVDSGSRDGSVDLARARGVEVLELDPARPFSAARARNEGFAALGADRADFVQFIDADCLLVPGWLERACAYLDAHPQAGLVIGRYREEAPDVSVYNWLTDWEWDKPEGPEAAGIGTFMARAEAVAQTGGFRDSMIAAEDDEMFLRMRGLGWQTWSVKTPMCTHDAGLHRFRPWWLRMIRAGHSFAELGALHPGTAAAARKRAVLWGGACAGIDARGRGFVVALGRAGCGAHSRGDGAAGHAIRADGGAACARGGGGGAGDAEQICQSLRHGLVLAAQAAPQ